MIQPRRACTFDDIFTIYMVCDSPGPWRENNLQGLPSNIIFVIIFGRHDYSAHSSPTFFKNTTSPACQKFAKTADFGIVMIAPDRKSPQTLQDKVIQDLNHQPYLPEHC
jgi:hypothetical protein